MTLVEGAPSKIKLSAVMITLNADRRLEQVLQSLNFCNEIIIIDSGSTDRTLEIARKFNVQVIQRNFDHFSAQKQFAVDQAKNDWVFVIDSDEVVSKALRDEIAVFIGYDSKNPEVTKMSYGFEVPRVLVFLGHQIPHCGGIDFPLRIFDRRHGRFNGARVHEKVLIDGKPRRLFGFIEHYSYDSLESYFQKYNRYTTLAAQELYQGGVRVSRLKMVTCFPSTFFKLYFLKFGILDGFLGFLWCFLSATSPLVKYAKLSLLYSRASAGPQRRSP